MWSVVEFEVKADLGVRLFVLINSNAIGADTPKLNDKWSRAQGVCFLIGTIFPWEIF